MDDWIAASLKQLEATIASTATSLEAQIDPVIEAWAAQSDRLTAELDAAIAPALDQLTRWETALAQQVEAWLPKGPTPEAEAFARRVDDWVDDWTDESLDAVSTALRPLEQTVKPWLNQHAACLGCRHYHGEAYGDDPVMLVCAMHPFGSETDRCPDWESTWQNE